MNAQHKIVLYCIIFIRKFVCKRKACIVLVRQWIDAIEKEY